MRPSSMSVWQTTTPLFDARPYPLNVQDDYQYVRSSPPIYRETSVLGADAYQIHSVDVPGQHTDQHRRQNDRLTPQTGMLLVKFESHLRTDMWLKRLQHCPRE